MSYDNSFLSYFELNNIYLLIIILIIIVVVLGFLFKNIFNKEFILKIKQSNCPDFWKDLSNGNGSNCVNIQNLGKCSEKNVDFTTSKWNGNNSMCKKYEWARKCDLTWDGITNNPDITKCSQIKTENIPQPTQPIKPEVKKDIIKPIPPSSVKKDVIKPQPPSVNNDIIKPLPPSQAPVKTENKVNYNIINWVLQSEPTKLVRIDVDKVITWDDANKLAQNNDGRLPTQKELIDGNVGKDINFDLWHPINEVNNWVQLGVHSQQCPKYCIHNQVFGEPSWSKDYTQASWRISNQEGRNFMYIWKNNNKIKQLDFDNNTVCGVTTSNNLFCAYENVLKNNVKWIQITNKNFNYITISDGKLYGLESNGNIWYADNYKNPKWKKIDGSLKQVNINGNIVCGVNSNNNIYCKDNLENSNWFQVPGGLTHVTVSNEKLYGVNSNGDIWFADNYKDAKWIKIPGPRLKQIEIDNNSNKLCGIDNNDDIYCKKDNSQTSIWEKITGKLKNISLSNGSMYGSNSNNDVYFANT